MTFDINELSTNPFDVFTQWYSQALSIDTPNPNAVILSSISIKTNQPSSRVVLLKQWDEQGFVFFTNYTSRKGQEITDNPNVALLFYWDDLFRQVRIEGIAKKVTREESSQYYNSRPLASRIGAWASKQSQILTNTQELKNRFAYYKQKYNNTPTIPDFWGGYRVIPQRMEFWHGEHARLHQRMVYSRQDHTAQWHQKLLYP